MYLLLAFLTQRLLGPRNTRCTNAGGRFELTVYGKVILPTQNLATALAERGNHVTVVTTNLFDSPSIETEPSGVEVVRLPSHRLLKGRLPIPRRNGEYHRLMDCLRAEKLDGILVNTRFYPHSLEGMRLAQSQGVRPVVLDHGSAYLTLGQPVIDAVIARYEHVVTSLGRRYDPRYFGVSQASCQWLETFGVQAEGVLGNSIDADAYRALASDRSFRDEFRIGENALLVAFVGRITPEKGIANLTEAARQLQDTDIHFLAAGTGSLLESMKESAPQNLTLLGALPPEDVSALLKQADIFCLPTRSEGFCTALLEAGAWECVPVITHVGGTDELIPTSETGIILADSQPDTIAAAIRQLAADWPHERIRGQRLRSLVDSEYSWKSAAERVEMALG